MARVDVESGQVIVTITGIDRVLAFKGHLTIPLSHVRSVSIRPQEAQAWFHGFRAPGTSIPGVITAGTFYTEDGMVFYDVHDPEQTVCLDLDHEEYRKVIVQVDDPDATAQAITAALPNE